MTIELLWSTPLYRKNINDPDLIHSIAAEIISDPDACSSNACELTREKVLKRVAENDGVFSVAVGYMRLAVNEFLEQAYGVVTDKYTIEPFYLLHRQGGNVSYHNHCWSTLTGILYINVPSGNVVLVDPRMNANRAMLPEITKSGHFAPVEITPKAGDLVIFPSYVFHIGTPNLSGEPRMVLPFDVNSLTDAD